MQKITTYIITGLTALCFSTPAVFSQQLKLGKNPYTVEKSAVLELQSDNQGLLFSRITDTTLINALNPLAGTVIYHVPSQQLMLRANNKWTPLAAGVLTATGWSKTGDAGTNPSVNFLGTTDNQDLVFRTNNTERARIISSSGDVKIGDANSGTLRSAKELVLKQDGDTYGSSILRLRNRTAENGAIFETTDPSTTLVDFIFKTAASQRNIRFEGRSGYARTGTSSFHIGGASPDNPTLSVGDSYAAFNTFLKIGNYTTPTEALDVAGNVKFSGALMPDNNAGTAGYLLKSNGAGSAPAWISPSLNNLSDITVTGAANGQILRYNGSKWVNVTPSYLTQIDTTDIAGFSGKVRSLFSAGSGISYNAATGVITATGGSGGSGSGWSLSGNTGIANSFLGSTDNSPLILKVNNAQVGRFDANNLALGATAQVQGASNSLSIGSSAYSSSNNAIAIGNTAQVQGTESIAIGKSAYVSTANAIAIGNTAQSQGTASIVMGPSSYASGTNSIAIGANNAKAQNTSAISIGPATYTSGSASIAIGENAQSQGQSAIVMGKNAYASGANSISIGGTEAGSTKAQGAGAISLGNAAVSYNANGIAMGNEALANSQGGIALGYSTFAGNTYSIAIGDDANAGSANSVALGKSANTGTYTNSVAIGANASAGQNDAIILGEASNASLEVGIGTSTPAAKLDVSGTVKLGSKGSVTKNLVNFDYDFSTSASIPKSSGNYTAGTYELTVNIPAANTLSSTRGVVSVSSNQDLPAGVSIASARIASTSTVKIRFFNHNDTSAATLPSTLNLYISIVEF